MKNGLLGKAIQYGARGWYVFPVHNGKNPSCKWGKESASAEGVVRSHAQLYGQASGIGIDCGKSGLVVVDLDVKDGIQGPAAWESLKSKHGFTDDGALVAQTGGGGTHIYFKDTTGGAIHNSAGALANGVDIRANGGYVVAPGSRHNSGAMYEWLRDDGIGNIPDKLVELILNPVVVVAPITLPVAAVQTDPDSGAWATAALLAELDNVKQAPESTRNNTLNQAAFSLGQIVGAGYLDRFVVESSLESCAISIGLSKAEILPTIKSGMDSGVMQPRGPKDNNVSRTAAEIVGQRAAVAPIKTAAKRMLFRHTDIGNAERLVYKYRGALHFCHPWNRWLVWDGRRWLSDDAGILHQMAKETVRSMYAEASSVADEGERKSIASWAMKSENRTRLDAMIGLAKSEPGVPVQPDDLDDNKWFLTVNNGTIDLRTGELLAHSPGDSITKLVPVDYDANAQSPLWQEFIYHVTGENSNLVDFLQRAVGYSLTGDTGERSLFFLYGSGCNGKTVFLETIRAAAGDYGLRTPTETLLAKRGDSIPNDVARLKGARLVTASETEEGKQLAESLVKDLTGQDTISARFMRSEWFAFQPQCKIWLATNHKPVVKGTGRAIWDRIKLVPFTVTIEEDKMDKNLAEKLRSELPGILAWAVKGCLEWQRQGLGVPTEVESATQSYRDEMDVVGSFIDDCCVVSDTSQDTSKNLYMGYCEWCNANVERLISKRAFATRLAERGFDQFRTKRDRGWIGLEIAQMENIVLPGIE